MSDQSFKTVNSFSSKALSRRTFKLLKPHKIQSRISKSVKSEYEDLKMSIKS
jgi:hypothetical protein